LRFRGVKKVSAVYQRALFYLAVNLLSFDQSKCLIGFSSLGGFYGGASNKQGITVTTYK
jgi:hypothetical protein